MCGRGSSETCPPWYAVRSPPRSAAHACAASCRVVEKRKTTKYVIASTTCSTATAGGRNYQSEMTHGSRRAQPRRTLRTDATTETATTETATAGGRLRKQRLQEGDCGNSDCGNSDT